MATITSLDFNINSHWDGSGVRDAKRELDELSASLKTISDANVRVNLDDTGARAKIDELKASLDSLSNKSVRIELDDSGAQAKVDALKAKLDAMGNHSIKIEIDDAAASAKVDALKAKLDTLRDKTINIRVDADDHGSINRLNDNLNRTEQSGQRASRGMTLFTAGLALLPALINPITPAIVGITGATVAMGASAGSALGAYGLAMKGAIDQTLTMKTSLGALKDNLENQQKILATLSPGTAAYEKELKKVQTAQDQYNNALKAATPAQQKFIESTDRLSDAWKNFIAATQNDTLKAASTVLDAIASGVGKLIPLVHAVAPLIQQVADAFKRWVEGDGLTRFINIVTSQGIPALKALLQAGGSALKTLMDGFIALAPLGTSVAEALERGAQSMQRWADNGGFQRFMDKIRSDGPSVKEFFKNLLDALKNVGQALADLGPFGMGFLNLILQIVAALPPGVLAGIAAGFLAVRTAIAAVAIAKSVGTAIDALTAAMTAARFAALALDMSLLPFLLVAGLVVAVVVALGIVVYLMVTRWHEFASYISGSFMSAVHAVWDGLKQFGAWIMTGLRAAWDGVKTAWSATWNGIKTAADTVWNGLKTAWNATVNGLKTAWDTVSNALKTAWNATWNALKTAGQTVWNAIKTAWQTAMNGLKTAWDTVSNALKTAWNAVWNALKTTAQTVWNAMKTAWNTFLTGVRTVWNTISNALKTAWQTFWNALKTTAQTVWNAIKAAWQTFLNAVKTIWDTVSNAFKTAWQTFWDAIKTAAQAVWDALKTAWQALWDAVKQIWDTASNALKTAWDATWNALKSAAQKIWNEIKSVIGAAVNAVIGIINGLIGAWNAVAGAVGLPHIGTIGTVSFAYGGIVGDPPAFAQGGVVHIGAMMTGGGVLGGYEPGIDTVPAMLSKGEGVLVPEAVRGLGADFVHGANHHFSGGRAGFPTSHFAEGGIVQSYAGGGFVEEIPVPGGGTAGQPATPGQSGGTNDPGSGPGISIPGLPTVAQVTAMFMEWINKFKAMSGPLEGPLGVKGAEYGMKMLEKVIQALLAKLAALAAAAAKAAGGLLGKAVGFLTGGGSLSQMASRALAAAGISQSQLGAFLALIQRESGGNPNAINNWDINAQRGTPSIGLAQVIQPTFDAYRLPGDSSNIYDPQANLDASANYIAHVYGGNVPGSPYAGGTNSATPGWHLVGERGPEAVNFGGGGGQVKSFEDTIRGIATGLRGGGGDVNLSVPITINGAEKTEDVMRRVETELLPKLSMMLKAHVGGRRP